MKKYLLLALTLLTTSVYSQTIIMEEYGGVYKIPCLVNGAKMKLIFDTGASNVSLSMTMAEYLLDNEYISKDDIIGKGKSSVADGSIVDHVIINLRDIEIAGLHLTNVEAIVIEGQNAPLLLGQSAIQKLGKITLEGNVLSIGNTQDTSQLQEGLIEQGIDYYLQNLYNRAYECFNQAEVMGNLDDFSLYCYANTCRKLNDYPKALSLINQIKGYDWFLTQDINIYYYLAWIHELNNFYDEAIAYYQLAISANVNSDTEEDKISYRRYIANIYFYSEHFGMAKKEFEKVFDSYAIYCKIDREFLMTDLMGKLKKGQQSYRNVSEIVNIDDCFFKWLYSLWKEGGQSSPQFYWNICDLARKSNKAAQQYINSIHYCCECDVIDHYY